MVPRVWIRGVMICSHVVLINFINFVYRIYLCATQPIFPVRRVETTVRRNGVKTEGTEVLQKTPDIPLRRSICTTRGVEEASRGTNPVMWVDVTRGGSSMHGLHRGGRAGGRGLDVPTACY